MVVILYKLLDINTKNELRKIAFNFLLLVLDSYDDLLAADKEYVALFNYALDHSTIRNDSSKPAYYLKMSAETNFIHTNMSRQYNEYKQYFLSFQELNRFITENPHSLKSDEGVRVKFVFI